MSSMLLYRIKALCQQQNITVTELSKLLGFSAATIIQWEKSSASVDKVKLVANYFNVSVDYLLGLTEISTKADEMFDDPQIKTLQRLRSNMSSKNRDKMMKLLSIQFEEDFPKEDEI